MSNFQNGQRQATAVKAMLRGAIEDLNNCEWTMDESQFEESLSVAIERLRDSLGMLKMVKAQAGK